MLKADRRIRALDLRHSQLNDNGRERELDSVVSLSPSLLARRLGTDFFGGSPDRSAGGDTPRTRTAHLRCTRPRPGAALPSRGPHGAPVSPRPLRDTGAEPHEPQSRGTSLAVRGLVRRCSRLRILSVEAHRAQGRGKRCDGRLKASRGLRLPDAFRRSTDPCTSRFRHVRLHCTCLTDFNDAKL